ncbi:MAG: lactonase family protein [Bacteroidales bacterium]|nr:lactonase family protein [Bacteroidales bacterium]
MKRLIGIAMGLCLMQMSSSAQTVSHPAIGSALDNSAIRVEFVGRIHRMKSLGEVDKDIISPKSANIHPSGEKYYVNSLEGARTVVYDMETNAKLKVIQHRFDEQTDSLWAPESGLFPFHHSYKEPNHFEGRPVESTFTHGGRYLWVPYYRRNFDLNAQDPSALAVIDTECDSIVRMFETGPLPKMIAASGDGKYVAVTHWGDNTVGLLDIASEDLNEWKYVACLVVDHQLKLDYSLTTKVNRDAGSGYALRGTVFTPDSRYLLVGCMGGSGGIAVFDLESMEYKGRMMGGKPNLRHLVIDNGYIYASINATGYVQRIPLGYFLDAIEHLTPQTPYKLDGWKSCKVPAGARTIVLSPDGRYIFVSCNFGSVLAVVDASKMELVGTVPADSYPVGLDISEDGKLLIMTCQGRSTGGGNAVDLFKVDYIL